MEGLLVEDDISILNHEEASPEAVHFRDSPIATSSGDESVASHFALVTAYEDIKKRLKETENENSALKKRARSLEGRLLSTSVDNEKRSLGDEQVNKAFQAYREVRIERDKMKQKLEKMIQEQMDSVRILNETLQAKEVEVLQLRSEVETHQVMDSLHRTQNSWDKEKAINESMVHALKQELEVFKWECNSLRVELQNCKLKEITLKEYVSRIDAQKDDEEALREVGLQKAYQELKKEMSNVRMVAKVQAELLQKLLATQGSTKNALLHGPVQCLDDLVRDCSELELNSTGAVYRASRSSSEGGHVQIPNFTGTRQFQQGTAVLSAEELVSSWINRRPTPVGSAALDEIGSCGKNSFDDNSWVFAASPMIKPNQAGFWTTGNTATSSAVQIPGVSTHDPELVFRS
ncbi:5-azacytidine-induced protein 2 [Callorhinchus milii]|uniref:5-azacytidine-induced protein 2 n=1 Tax=Callorhinchus milii TaxID=7868 RepID=V9KT79_CALMI|nr:5-azacytidine-induced protein 2 [Callorhinchus milii]|eukprot:gi/632977159/ref/XP_007905194.1/ PREDICTED: 5-azacytidine-induced protein 2 [Callorhinchus milii]